MTNESHKRQENPLEDAAAEISEGLGSQTVEVSDSSKDSVQGGQVSMKNSAARSINASALHMEDSAAMMVQGGSLEAADSVMGVAYAREMQLQDVAATVVVGQEVKAEEVRAVFLIAGKAEGKIRAMLTPLTAAAVGAGFGVAWFALATLVRRLAVAKTRKTKVSSQ